MISIWLILSFLIALVLAAFFCSAETAFVSVQKLKLQHLVRTEQPGARSLAKILEQPERFLATVLFGINFFETAVASIGTVIATSIWSESQNVALAVATVVITVLTLVFAELIPKTLAARFGERLAVAYARPIELAGIVLFPFAWVFGHIGIGFARIAADEADPRPTLSEAEFRTAIRVGEEEGVVEEKAAEMLHNVFEFGNRPVREVMIPRLEVISIERGATLSGFLELYARSPLNRFPVYEGTMDSVVGILSIKDVMMGLARGTVNRDSKIDELIRPAYFTPETKPINELFLEMRDNNYRMAVIIDEFGGTSGVVSLTQLVEEIVGPVGDELARAEKDYEAIDEHTFQVDGSMRVEEANEEMKLGLPEGDYETMAGFVLHLIGRIPKQGEQLKYHGLKIVITKMRGLKIEEILVSREKVADLPEETNAAAEN